MKVDFIKFNAVDQDLPALRIQDSGKEIYERRLPDTGWPHDGRRRVFLRFQVHPFKNQIFPVTELHITKLDFSFYMDFFAASMLFFIRFERGVALEYVI